MRRLIRFSGVRLGRLTLLAMVLLTLAVSASARGGNAANAKLCRKGGWMTWVRADQTPFLNQGDCVSYAAKGGTLTPKSAAQASCEGLGGTFGTDPDSDLERLVPGSVTLWTCNQLSVSPVALEPLSVSCTDAGGTLFSYSDGVEFVISRTTCLLVPSPS